MDERYIPRNPGESAAYANGVADERERCGKIAEELYRQGPELGRTISQAIAAAIRNKVTSVMFIDREITIKLLPREDGGVRVYSDDVPGLILSGSDPLKVLADIGPALKVLTIRNKE